MEYKVENFIQKVTVTVNGEVLNKGNCIVALDNGEECGTILSLVTNTIRRHCRHKHGMSLDLTTERGCGQFENAEAYLQSCA